MVRAVRYFLSLLASLRRQRYASGGVLKPRAHGDYDDRIMVRLSPGWYEVSPQTLARYSPEVLDKINKSKRDTDE